jgi:hypothetical protein
MKKETTGVGVNNNNDNDVCLCRGNRVFDMPLGLNHVCNIIT